MFGSQRHFLELCVIVFTMCDLRMNIDNNNNNNNNNNNIGF